MFVVEELRPHQRLYQALLAEQPKVPLTPALQALAAEGAELLLQYQKAWYAIGAFYVRVRDSGEAAKAGMTVDTFWIQNIPTTVLSLQTVHKLERISERFPPTITKAKPAYGWSLLDLVITYADRNHIPLPNDPAKIPIRWTDADGSHELPFAQCGQTELTKALAHAHKPDVPMPTLAQQLYSFLHARLDGALGPDGYLFKATMEKGQPNLMLKDVMEKFILACGEINDAAEEFANEHLPKQRQAAPRTRSKKKKNTVRVQPR